MVMVRDDLRKAGEDTAIRSVTVCQWRVLCSGRA